MDEGTEIERGDRSDSAAVQFTSSYDWSVTKPSIAAIDALATVANVDPRDLDTEFETTLYQHVDPTALDAIVGDERSGRTAIAFAFEDYQIRFDGSELAIRTRES